MCQEEDDTHEKKVLTVTMIEEGPEIGGDRAPDSLVAYLRRRSSAARNHSIDDYYEGVHNGRVLGSGVTAHVRIVREKETGEDWACKVRVYAIWTLHKIHGAMWARRCRWLDFRR